MTAFSTPDRRDLVIVIGAIDRPPEPEIVRSILDAFASARIGVCAPPGSVLDTATRRGLDVAVIDDLEPLAPGYRAMRAAARRARRAARSHRRFVAGADQVVAIGVEALIFAAAADEVHRAEMTLVLGATPIGPTRRALARHRGRIDRVLAFDARGALGLGPVVPETIRFAAPGEVGSRLAEATRPPAPRHEDSPAIVLAVPDYLPSLGGTTRQARNLAIAVRDAGERAAVLTQRIDRRWPTRQRVDRIDVVRLGPPSRRRLAMKLFVANAAYWMRRHRSDIAVVNAVMYPDLAVSAALAGLGRRSIVCWAGLGDATDTLSRDRKGPRRVLVALRRHLLRHTTHVALTEAIAEELRSLEIIDRVIVIPTPIDVARFAPPSPSQRLLHRQALGLADDEIAIVYVGQLRALKRVDQLVEAFAIVHGERPNTRLLLVGGSREDLEDRTDELRALTHRLGLAPVVVFTGFTGEVEPYLHAGDVFVLPSEREGLSNSLLEAMASGLACIAPASAGGDQVLTETTGIVPPSNAPDDLAAAMRVLVDDHDGRRAMGRAAAKAATEYSVSSIDARYRALYDELGTR